MAKRYTRINWQNRPSTATALGATNLNKMDVSINEIDNALIVVEADKLDKSIANTMVKSVLLDPVTGILTVTYLNNTVNTYDLAIEKVVTNFTLNAQNQLVLTLQDGTTQIVPLSSFIDTYTFNNSENIVVSTTGKTIVATIKKGSIQEDDLETTVMADIRNNALTAEGASADSLQYSRDSKRYAVGGVVSGDEIDNAEYYCEQANIAKVAAEAAATTAQSVTNIGIATSAIAGLVKSGGDIEVDATGNVIIPSKLNKTGDASETSITYESISVDPEVVFTPGEKSKTIIGKIITQLSKFKNKFASTDQELDEIKSSLSNPNLLINGDFQIWQRGESFTGYVGYSADRFKNQNYANIVRTGFGIKITSTEAGGRNWLIQGIEKLPNGIFTMTVKLRKSRADLQVRCFSEFTTSSTAWQTLKAPIALGGGANIVIPIATTDVGTLPNDWIEIEYVKLELGSIATPFVPRLVGEELLLCLRYYQNEFLLRKSPWGERFLFNGYQFFELLAPMRQNPTIILSGDEFITTGNIRVWGGPAIATSIEYAKVSGFTLDASNLVVGTPYYFNWTADAEIY